MVKLALADAGFLWGAVIVDRARTFRRQWFRLGDHLARFRQNCKSAFVPLAATDERIAEVAADLLTRVAGSGECSLILFATPGTPSAGPTLGIQVEPIDFSRYKSWMIDGARLQTVPDHHAVAPLLKHRSRLGWWIARHQVAADREPLFVSEGPESLIRETATANFLAVIDGAIVAPRPDVLEGVSSRTIRELCAPLGIPFAERPLPLAEALDRATECLLASTTCCLAPVAAIDAREWPRSPRSIFQALAAAWSARVGADILAPFLGNR